MDSRLVIGCGVALVVGILGFLLMGQSPSPSKSKTEPVFVPKKLVVAGPYTRESIKKHDNPQDGQWIIVDNKVYDITDYVKSDVHPGGDSILRNVGGDASAGTHGDQHPPSMWGVLSEYYIGDIVESEHVAVIATAE